MSRRILITCFEPFAGRWRNRSKVLTGKLWRWTWSFRKAGWEVAREVLPVSYEGSGPALRAAIAKHRPDLVIAIGEGSGEAIKLEKYARNLDDSEQLDNDGVCHRQSVIETDAPVSIPSGLDLSRFAALLTKHGIPCAESEDAGGFLCNRVFFELRRRGPAHGGFVHVPRKWKRSWNGPFWRSVLEYLEGVSDPASS